MKKTRRESKQSTERMSPFIMTCERKNSVWFRPWFDFPSVNCEVSDPRNIERSWPRRGRGWRSLGLADRRLHKLGDLVGDRASLDEPVNVGL